MDWLALAHKVIEFIEEHWIKAVIAIALTALSGWWAAFWAWRKWRLRQDADVLHISQNTIEMRPTGENQALEPWLVLDVISEDQLEKVISHPVPCQLIKKAALKTTVDQPFLIFPEADRWYVLNIVRLAIAEPFAIGTAAKMLPSAKVGTIDCIFALTYERYSAMRQGKLRVMLIAKSLLENPKTFDRPFRFESPQHSDRLTTLQKMQADYLKGKNSVCCMNVRLNILLGASEATPSR
ncbi:MAG: hypothetical protein U0903_07005 [Planctomycetales bacterium]